MKNKITFGLVGLLSVTAFTNSAYCQTGETASPPAAIAGTSDSAPVIPPSAVNTGRGTYTLQAQANPKVGENTNYNPEAIYNGPPTFSWNIGNWTASQKNCMQKGLSNDQASLCRNYANEVAQLRTAISYLSQPNSPQFSVIIYAHSEVGEPGQVVTSTQKLQTILSSGDAGEINNAVVGLYQDGVYSSQIK